MANSSPQPTHDRTDTVPAGMLAPWHVGDLPDPPSGGWRLWVGLIGPGVLLAGASIGTGEWLFGPAVSAQYGGTLLWLASLSIIGQVFCNLEVMRYTLYCGEPAMVGFFRTRPGPMFWTVVYAALDFASIWPYNASNAAVPLAAAILGHLPGRVSVTVLGWTMSEGEFVTLLGFVIYLAAFLPLIFGGTVYRMLEKVFTAKLVITLVYLVFFALFWVSASNAWEVFAGFFRFGVVPLRADAVIVGRHFTLLERDGPTTYGLKGTLENGEPLVTEFSVARAHRERVYKIGAKLDPEHEAAQTRMLGRALSLIHPGRFFVEDTKNQVTLRLQGQLTAKQAWQLERITVSDAGGERSYGGVADIRDEKLAARVRALVTNQGIEHMNLISYFRNRERDGLPKLNWAMIAAFVAIAGAGGLTNMSFSNYARDKGWGMGAQVGAIPSAVGGRLIALSHVGKVFGADQASLGRWRGWMRHIIRDNLAVWMVCSFIGMALPCMLSLQFIRNAPVEGTRVAAMTADGMAEQFPAYRTLLWSATLLVGFLVLAPGQIMAGDQIARRWTDIIWATNPRVQRLGGNQVKYIYYGILSTYGVWGAIVILARFSPLLIATVGAGLQNVAIGVASLHTLYVNRTLLPRELRPGWFMQLGLVFCGIVFLGISVIVVVTL
ncbi:MAG: Nramp family divalent metal transporter [Planctomycetes bacterium]|nr:Nramp family divalent metal transporter [Planctomycetota bacterium]